MANMATSTKLRHWLLWFIISALAACSSHKVKEKPPCMYADGSEKAAPLWVCYTPEAGFSLTGVGYADASLGGMDTSLRLARNEALTNLWQRLRTKLRHAIDLYTQQQRAADEFNADELRRSILDEISREMLDEAQQVASSTTPSGGAVVAMGLDAYDLESIGRTALQNAYLKHPQLWDQWLSKADFIQVQEAIVKPFSAQVFE